MIVSKWLKTILTMLKISRQKGNQNGDYDPIGQAGP